MSDPDLDDGPENNAWYADDFETTTDFDGAPEPYTFDADDLAEYQDLEPGESSFNVRMGSEVRGEPTRTITVTRSIEGVLSATTRTGRVRVWSWEIREVDGPGMWRGTEIADYVERAADLGGIHWFHNLRFDAGFLDSHLMSLDAPAHIPMGAGTWRKGQIPTACFSALISDTGAHYSRNVRLYDGRTFEVRDSLKKFPATTIAALSEMYGAPSAKGEIDYTAERPEGYRPTPEEWEYLDTDCVILATALSAARAAGATGLTIGGDAIREYRRTMVHGKFRAVFPLLDRETDEYIRLAYRGGWTYVNPEHQLKVLEPGMPELARFFPDGVPIDGTLGEVYDVNSMYPAVMRESPYPVGVPVRLAPGQLELEGYPHTIVGALLDATIKPGRLPIIQVKNDARYNPVQYQTKVRGVEWFGTEVDWKLLYEQYDVKIHEWIEGLAFQSVTGLFDVYIDKWMKVKETAKGGARTQSKFQLNNLWGRFAINPLRAARVPGLTFEGAPMYSTLPTEYGEPAYTAVGVWTTSYGRDRVIRAAQSFGDAFLGADTDSVHKLGIGSGDLEVHETKLGAWKREAVFTKATYLRAKSYAEEIGGEVEAHVAGLPRKLLEGLPVEGIKIGAKFSGKLVPKRVPGGIILESTDFEIGVKDAWGHLS